MKVQGCVAQQSPGCAEFELSREHRGSQPHSSAAVQQQQQHHCMIRQSECMEWCIPRNFLSQRKSAMKASSSTVMCHHLSPRNFLSQRNTYRGRSTWRTASRRSAFFSTLALFVIPPALAESCAVAVYLKGARTSCSSTLKAFTFSKNFRLKRKWTIFLEP